MKIAFYKAWQRNATAVDWFVAGGTLSNHSHVELVFSDGMSYSISGRESYSRFKDIEYNPNNWDIIDIDVTASEETELRKVCRTRLGIGYDYKGAFFSFYKAWSLTESLFDTCLENSDMIFCSEEVVNLLRKYTVAYSYLEEGCKYAPGRLYGELI